LLQPEIRVLELSTNYLKQGKVDLTIAGDMPTIVMAAEGYITVTALAKLSHSSLVTWNDYRHLRDLKGKKIGVPLGTTAHLGLMNIIEAADMTEDDIQLVPIKVNQLITALENRQIDAFVAWEPVASEALHKSTNFVAIHRSLNASYLYQSKDFSQTEQEASLLVHAAYVRALSWMKSSKANLLKALEWAGIRAEEFLGRKPLRPVEIAARITEDGILRYAKNPKIPRSDYGDHGYLFRAFQFLKKIEKVPSATSYAEVTRKFDNRILREVIQNRKKYRIDTFDYSD
jgi:ABC-type nitrate/sulfonate/bicarbonate transport system substrate-binding protein